MFDRATTLPALTEALQRFLAPLGNTNKGISSAKFLADANPGEIDHISQLPANIRSLVEPLGPQAYRESVNDLLEDGDRGSFATEVELLAWEKTWFFAKEGRPALPGIDNLPSPRYRHPAQTSLEALTHGFAVDLAIDQALRAFQMRVRGMPNSDAKLAYIRSHTASLERDGTLVAGFLPHDEMRAAVQAAHDDLTQRLRVYTMRRQRSLAATPGSRDAVKKNALDAHAYELDTLIKNTESQLREASEWLQEASSM